MCIIYYGCDSVFGTNRLQASSHAFQRTHHNENVFGILAQHDSSAIDSQKVADVELTDELHAYFSTVDFEIHAFKVTFDNVCAEVSHLAYGVGLDIGFAVLNHDATVFVIGIGDGKSLFGQSVEECLLGVAIVFESLMIVEVVACEIGEDASCKCQSADTFLRNGMA